ncbi:MAG: RIP metalloprotease RseP [Candidimonas sp.]|nr:MAG: RIP metalloprotease RseP [Candidimonas sp.]TAM26189.1 MAG: RIP metalloprotease RseP [Candidimonas sp.]TAM77021.1 MAG: RIP metalloprotease RseP [Candidimonas sp.]
MLFTLLAFAVALGVLITFHELGHYWVARRCGVKVLRFSVGFGRVIARHTDRQGTEWALSAIPLGGYVKMLDDPLPDASPEQAKQAFNRKSVAARFAIVLAGPMANLLLAAILYALLSLVGTREPAAILAAPASNTAAARAGFQGGDRITGIDGVAVRSWNEARWRLLDALATGGELTVTVDAPSGVTRERVLRLTPGHIDSEKTGLMSQAGLRLAAARPVVTQVTAGGAGDAAGLRAGDVVQAVGPQDHPGMDAMVREIQLHANRTLAMTVLRNGALTSLMITPRPETDANGKKVGRIGVLLGADFPMVTVRYGVFDSLRRGVLRTADTAWLSLKMMGRMVVGQVSLRNISGPVTIADYAGQTARIGLAAYLSFLALISVSIGVLNLLPIPLLDGGHLMYYLFEVVRGKPVPDKWRETGQRIGLGFLGALMALAFFNDFARLFS